MLKQLHLTDCPIKETIDYNPDFELLKQIPSHSRERLRQKTKQNDVKFL